MKKLLTIVMLIVISSACNKEEEGNPNDGSQTKILGKWYAVNYIDKISANGQDHMDTILPLPGEYVDFKSNGMLYTFTTTLDSSSYKIEDDRMTIITPDLDTTNSKITTLNSENLSLHFSETYNNIQYESWHNYKR